MRIYSKYEYEQYAKRKKDEFDSIEKSVVDLCLNTSKKEVDLPGYCKVCKQETMFHIDLLYGDGQTPNLRERLVCSNCHLNSRQRYIASVILKECNQNKKIYMYEQITDFYRIIRKHLKNVVGSEYIADGLLSGTRVNGILHENAENLSFPDNFFDMIVSCDVFEHVNNYKESFKEAFRVLNTDVKLIMTIPFHFNAQKNHCRAYIKENLILLDEPVYHGNPISEKGSLVFWDYGWDLLDEIRNIGFKEVYVEPYFSEKHGYFGGIPCVFIAEKI